MAVPSLDRRMAVLFALIGFLSVTVMGLAMNGQPKAVAVRALVAGAVGFVVGRAVGFVTVHLTREILPPPVSGDQEPEPAEGQPPEEGPSEEQS